ncbi:MAG: bifunctional endoribonuclease/protein kinase ire1 [Vezdaea aestivalis]|nr:MAG: bifunctional endoribonuclease/protein kinase ire1 [Vezdaea aestivalis]
MTKGRRSYGVRNLLTLVLVLSILQISTAGQNDPQHRLKTKSALRNANQNGGAKPINDDESAIATLAPAKTKNAVRAPPDTGLKSSQSAGLSSLLNARSLQGWEVEDFVLLATVDGTIHARDRRTGAYRWSWESDQPMVQTIYNNSKKEDELVWIIEPSRDGALYIYNPSQSSGIQKLPLTVKKLVEELSPFAGEDPAVVYTGEKKSTLYTVDARTGHILKTFSSAGPNVVDDRKCRVVGSFDPPEEEECGSGGILTLGRIDYTVGIASRDTGAPVCTLKYTEWGPNNRDSDLQSQYENTMDQKYVYSRHDGSIFGFDHTQYDERRPLYKQKLPSPVARVFDVARPQESDSKDTPLVILPQPIGPSGYETFGLNRDRRVFVNCTEDGGWYAMSEASYPLVTGGASEAQCYNQDWLEMNPDDELNLSKRNMALVGVHPLESFKSSRLRFPSISGPVTGRSNETVAELPSNALSPIQRSRFVGFAANNAFDIFTTLLIGAFVSICITNRKTINRLLAKKMEVGQVSIPGGETLLPGTFPDDADNGEVDSDSKTLNVPKKKTTHRGRRGTGRKKLRKENSTDLTEEKVDKIIEGVKAIDSPQSLQPDVTRAPKPTDTVTDMSGSFQIGGLYVSSTEIGLGSNGTVVFQGNFEGRDVAVKRMLAQFCDVADQEIAVLQESDDHPNVIRYFCKQESSGMVFIALELCETSLQNLIAKPQDHPALGQATQKDLPNVLYQIASGVRYLHSLKIVHRDLKPQNILVAPAKASRTNPDLFRPPRILISDFGLCKKLDGAQSSFRATTAHAAGTSGWRAPELLVDEDDPRPFLPTAASVSDTSEPAVIDTLSNRRATRAIDIFSLGCVFYYVLTGGAHPFGDRYMREGNIIKNQPDLSQLESLGDSSYEARDMIERMIQHAPRFRLDATQVMLHPFFWSPEKRLNFLVDVSDHFEFEPREPPSAHLLELEKVGITVHNNDFLKRLDRAFTDTLGKQRKYTSSRMLDLLRALRNKKNHYQDMPENVKIHVGPLPEGYLSYWTVKFPALLLQCYGVVINCQLQDVPRFRAYFGEPPP